MEKRKNDLVERNWRERGKYEESVITIECPYCGVIIKFKKLGSAPVGKVKIRCRRCKRLFNYSEVV